ncbi:hypothetical protein [Actinokineospora enzanensis]|uniref:hypothetical protein n=1 Tax=Actinokineospora enzanensis TaxID=155975 RepID=UPI0003A65C27|nr:hypothetical protein [Actinokineospora enzanensis]
MLDRTTPEEAVPTPHRPARPTTPGHPGAVGASTVLALQRTVGNRAAALAVQRVADPREGLWSPDTETLLPEGCQGGTDTPWRGGRISFNTAFKASLINEKWADRPVLMTDKGGRREVVRTFHADPHYGNWVPLIAYQMDHILPWAEIRQALAEMTTWPTDKPSARALWEMRTRHRGIDFGQLVVKDGAGWAPSMYAATMYYHNAENLQPLEGSLNAAKGKSTGNPYRQYANSADKVGDKHLDLERRLTRVYLTLLDKIQHMGHHANGDDSWIEYCWQLLQQPIRALESISVDQIQKLDASVRAESDAMTPVHDSKLTVHVGTPPTPPGVSGSPDHSVDEPESPPASPYQPPRSRSRH